MNFYNNKADQNGQFLLEKQKNLEIMFFNLFNPF